MAFVNKKNSLLTLALLTCFGLSSCGQSDEIFITWTSLGNYYTPTYEKYNQESIPLEKTLDTYFSDVEFNDKITQDLMATESYVFSQETPKQLTYNIWVKNVDLNQHKISFLVQILLAETGVISSEIQANNIVYSPQYVSFVEAQEVLYFAPKYFKLDRGEISIQDAMWDDSSWNIKISNVSEEGRLIVDRYSWKTFLPEQQEKLASIGLYFILKPFYFTETTIDLS